MNEKGDKYLEEVGMKGPNKVELKNREQILSGLKFSTTSYNNEVININQGLRLHLLLTIYKVTESGSPLFLVSCISPPIMVDSRKAARDGFFLLVL